MNNALTWLALVAGVVCIGIGLAPVVFGTGAAPGIGDANATAESGDRFYGAVFVGYGVAWLWGAMQDPLPAKLFRFLAAIMLLGGMGRVIAFAAEGRPHQMFIGLTVVEFVFPAPVFFLASNGERPRQTAH